MKKDYEEMMYLAEELGGEYHKGFFTRSVVFKGKRTGWFTTKISLRDDGITRIGDVYFYPTELDFLIKTLTKIKDHQEREKER